MKNGKKSFNEFVKRVTVHTSGRTLAPSYARVSFHKFLLWWEGEAERSNSNNPKLNGKSLEYIQTVPVHAFISEQAIEERVTATEARFKNGIDPDLAELWRPRYEEWRRQETSRRRADAARVKAKNAKEKKPEAPAKKKREQEKPHFTSMVDAEMELESRSFEEWKSEE